MDEQSPLILVIAGRSRQRRQPLLDQLNTLGVRYRIIPAVYLDPESARELPSSQVTADAFERMALSEIGCALAHQAAYACAQASGASHTLILEDDAVLSDRLPELLSRLHELPAYDVILLSRAKISRHEYRFSRWYYPVSAAMRIGDIRIGLTRRTRRCGTSAYLVSSRALEKLCHSNLPVRTQADDWPQFMTDLEVLQCSPLLVYEDYLGKGSEIQHERSISLLAERHLSLRKQSSLLLRALIERLSLRLFAIRFSPRDRRQVRRKT